MGWVVVELSLSSRMLSLPSIYRSPLTDPFLATRICPLFPSSPFLFPLGSRHEL